MLNAFLAGKSSGGRHGSSVSGEMQRNVMWY